MACKFSTVSFLEGRSEKRVGYVPETVTIGLLWQQDSVFVVGAAFIAPSFMGARPRAHE